MKYIKKSSDNIVLENGTSRIRVRPVCVMPDPNNIGRMARVFHVEQVMRDSAKNPIRRGQQIALSFPPAKINASEYRWHPENGEPCQISMRVKP
jgi:hypothetical protein